MSVTDVNGWFCCFVMSLSSNLWSFYACQILSYIYSSGNKFVVFCRVAAALQNTTNLFPLLYTKSFVRNVVNFLHDYHWFETV